MRCGNCYALITSCQSSFFSTMKELFWRVSRMRILVLDQFINFTGNTKRSSWKHNSNERKNDSSLPTKNRGCKIRWIEGYCLVDSVVAKPGHLSAGAYDSFKNENHNGLVHNPSHSWTPANFPILSLLLCVSARSVSGGRVFHSSLDEHSNSSCRLPPSPSALTLTLCQYGRSYTWLARSSRALAWCSRVSTDLRYITIMTSFCFPFSVGLWKIKGQKRYNFRVECVLSIPSSWASYCTLSRLVLLSAMTASSLVAKKQQTEYLPSMHFTITYICGRCVCACRSW